MYLPWYAHFSPGSCIGTYIYFKPFGGPVFFFQEINHTIYLSRIHNAGGIDLPLTPEHCPIVNLDNAVQGVPQPQNKYTEYIQYSDFFQTRVSQIF